MRIRYCRCFSFSYICQHLLNQLILIRLLSAFLLYSIRMLANLYKCLTIIANAFVINKIGLQLLMNILRICFPYGILPGTCFLDSQYLLNGPNAYEYERMSGDELANIVICKRIRAIMVSPLFLGCFGPIRLILAGFKRRHTHNIG